jgi:hypothetical protein
MRTQLTALFLLTLSNLFAQTGFDENDYDSYFELSNYLTNADPTANIVTEPCAVYIRPTSERIEQLKKEYGEEDFYVVADDNNWYDYQSSELLDSLNIKAVYFESGIIKFQGTSNSWILNMNQPEAPAWNFILFNPNKTPVIASTVDLTIDQLKEFFGVE